MVIHNIATSHLKTKSTLLLSKSTTKKHLLTNSQQLKQRCQKSYNKPCETFAYHDVTNSK